MTGLPPVTNQRWSPLERSNHEITERLERVRPMMSFPINLGI